MKHPDMEQTAIVTWYNQKLCKDGSNEKKPEKDHVEEKLEVQYCLQFHFCHVEYAEETKESHRLFQPARPRK